MTASTDGSRPPFDPVDTSFNAAEFSVNDNGDAVVESPSLSSSNALARFEFEPGRSKDGTKVLMVEWEDDDTTESIPGDWEISWEGKRTVLPARDQTQTGEEAAVNRLYFLLGAGVPVPSTITLQRGSVVWKTNPLPAIFSPELGASARQAGKKGVLHTIWAKKRLQVLQKEIDTETKNNVEGIGLEMVLAEKEWIEQNFGVVTKPASISIPSQNAMSTIGLNSPTSPRTPGGGRLMEKLKGLKLGTSERDLTSARKDSNAESVLQSSSFHNPLSPESSDVAVGSFGSFAALKGMPSQSSMAAKPAQPPQATRRMAPQRPPDSVLAQQRQAGMGSLNAFAGGSAGLSSSREGPEEDKEDDLFALPMSPRSPDMTKSPFSFGSQDTMRYLRGERA